MKKLLLLLLLILLITACEEIPEEPIEPIETEWISYEDTNGFSIETPNWEGDYEFDDSLFLLTNTVCNVAVNKYEGNAENMYSWLSTYLEEQGTPITYQNEEKVQIEYTSNWDVYLFKTRLNIYDCNSYAYNVMYTCEYYTFEEKEEEMDQYFDSVDCDQSAAAPVEYAEYTDADFSITIPDWDVTPNTDGLILTNNLCNIYISTNENNKDLVESWMLTSLEDCDDCTVLSKTPLEYTSYYEETLMKSQAQFNYCNYETYIVAFTCADSYFDEDIANEVINSIDCENYYEPIEEEVIEEEQEEEVEEIKQIVDLTLPEEYDVLDPEWVIYFINSNEFFTYILEDYPKVNLILEGDTNFNIKADLNNGVITYVEEGLHDDGVSIYIPGEDAVDILDNINNINFINFLVFASKITTDPVELKQEVINKILGQ
jgi:hypothetical protein